MMRYSIEPRYRTFQKGYGSLFFAKNMCKNLSKRIRENQSKASGNFIGNKIADKITKASKSSPQNNSGSKTDLIKERYISPQKDNKLLIN